MPSAPVSDANPEQKDAQNLGPMLPAFPGAMTGAVLRVAIARLGQFAIGANAGLCVQAPEQALIASRYRGIGLGKDELAFPAQR
jgi:hypothetical protein